MKILQIVFPVFSCSMVLAILSTLHTLSIVQQNIALVMLLEFLSPLLNLVSLKYLIDAKSAKQQFAIASIIGCGYASGAAIGLMLNNYFV